MIHFHLKTRIKYEKPIQISEGETEIKAVSVNANGIPSLTVSKTYEVELPIEDAPAVSPSTGQYDTDTKISICCAGRLYSLLYNRWIYPR